ncbi:hypothetical protein F5876DRAFT_70958 [Lentinula aff. lateritia]|uniref:Uncharacterized protein n=1 Tax=Lentinula aff. lateritia TaxID=2804960 RepID=A0ACC1THE7_9AGAR|nr:hypothetical protein F5876DRAFT_70958 [Lentinula aff. lateritia]
MNSPDWILNVDLKGDYLMLTAHYNTTKEYYEIKCPLCSKSTRVESKRILRTFAQTSIPGTAVIGLPALWNYKSTAIPGPSNPHSQVPVTHSRTPSVVYDLANFSLSESPSTGDDHNQDCELPIPDSPPSEKVEHLFEMTTPSAESKLVQVDFELTPFACPGMDIEWKPGSCKTWVGIGLRVGFGIMGLCCSMLRAGWSLKGATGTATEDRNDLVVAGLRDVTHEEVPRTLTELKLPMECKPGREVPGSGGRDGCPQVLEGVTEKRSRSLGLWSTWGARGGLGEVGSPKRYTLGSFSIGQGSSKTHSDCLDVK